MARLPREDEPGAWHHVINRGIAKRPLFETRDDARFFLARIARQIRLGRIEVHAYCLMTTHFHLLVRSPIGRLSEAMRRAQNEHSRHFNRRRHRDGALIRGRYFSRPVKSIEYRRALVKYIDANPVRAGMATSCGEHEFGSAAAYLTRSGPLWLSREWVEAEACRIAAAERFTAAVYRAAFGGGDARERFERGELIDARSTRAPGKDPLDDLIGMAPQEVRSWMQRKARLADGHKVGVPVCGRRSLRRALNENVERLGVWMVEDGRHTWRGADVAWMGLLHDLCGCTWREVAHATGVSVSRANRLGARHRRLLRINPAYVGRAAQIGHDAIRRCLR